MGDPFVIGPESRKPSLPPAETCVDARSVSFHRELVAEGGRHIPYGCVRGFLDLVILQILVDRILRVTVVVCQYPQGVVRFVICPRDRVRVGVEIHSVWDAICLTPPDVFNEGAVIL